MAEKLVRLSEHLAVFRGHINVGILHEGEKALLFDLGDGSVLDALKGLGVESVEAVALTHHHRDQACGAWRLDRATRIGAPAAELAHFVNVAAYWNDAKSRWGLIDFHPFRLVLVEPVRVDASYADNESFAWGPAKITALATPGHTDGSMSYVVDADGQRTVFCGDAIYDHGQVWDLHSLQKGTVTTDYHGFLGSRPQLAASFDRIKEAKPAVLVPSHGKIMREPAKAIDLLAERLERCYDKYVAICALRHYFPDMFKAYAGRPGHMPIRPGKAAPACLRHFDTTWLLVSKDKAAFAIDVCSPNTAKQIQKLVEAGEIRSVEGIWITHYHYDHIDGIPDLVKAFGCPVITDRHVADVVSDPLAWRLTCLSPNQIKVDRATRDGESWQWHEFKMTAYHFPGQTLYHGGLVVEGAGAKMLFAGDSYTMAGIDDYCTHNRNRLGKGVGFDYCLDLTARLKPTHIFNEHVDPAFDFTDDEIAFMRANLAEREKLFGEVVPWDHANYGLDEPWARCFPYEQKAAPGGEVAFKLVITNHSAEARKATCRAVLPSAWGRKATEWAATGIASRKDGEMNLAFRIPPDAKPGRTIIPVDLKYGEWDLPQFTEAIVVVE